MAIDTKKTIAEAALHILMTKDAKRLTVKDVVEECQITRQAFYYHFEDIPALFRWILERDRQKVLEEALAFRDAEKGMKYFFLVAINAAPFVKKECRRAIGMSFRKCCLIIIIASLNNW